MNEKNPELELIESATSATRGPSAATSNDEAALREGWSALSHVVAAADATDTFDETAFLTKLSSAIERDGTERRSGRSPQRNDGSRRTWFLLLSALAATIVVCVSAGIYFASQKWGGDTAKENGGGKTNQIVKSDVPSNAVDEGLGWDDALDDQIQYVNHSLYQLESGDSINDRSLRSFGSQLEEFGKEIEVDSL